MMRSDTGERITHRHDIRDPGLRGGLLAFGLLLILPACQSKGATPAPSEGNGPMSWLSSGLVSEPPSPSSLLPEDGIARTISTVVHTQAPRWLLDADGEPGNGERIIHRDLSAGAQVVTRKATDRFGAAGSGDGLGGPLAVAHTAVVVAEDGLAPMEALGREARDGSGRAVDLSGLGREDLAAGDAVVGTQAKPAGEVADGGEGGEVAASLGEEGLNGLNRDTGNGGQIHAEDPVELGAEVKT